MSIKDLDLFTPVVAAEKLHPDFLATISPHASGVKNVLNNWAKGLLDRDGKFVKEFQTTYNSCFWEPYVFAVIKEIKADVDFSFSTPDFVCNSGIEGTRKKGNIIKKGNYEINIT